MMYQFGGVRVYAIMNQSTALIVHIFIAIDYHFEYLDTFFMYF